MNFLKKYNRYLKGELSPEDSEVFTKSILKDYYEDEDRKKEWRTILEKEHPYPEDNLSPRKEIPFKKIASLIAIAASLAILFYFSFYAAPNKISDLDKVLAEYIGQPEPQSTRKGPLLDGLSLRNQAEHYYNEEDYKKAITIYKQIIQENQETEDDHFFLGLSYLYQKEYAAATEQFDWILNYADAQREDYATWYIALTLVSSKDYDRAKKYLNQVASWDNNSGRIKLAQKAQKLLDMIADKNQ